MSATERPRRPPHDRTRTGGEAVVAALVAGGVRHAFTVPGESFLGILDALYDAPLRVVTTRHEAGAGFMAEAYGQLTGTPAACLVTRAVGAANLSITLHTARQDSTPLVALVGQVPRAFRGREAFQEVDQVGTFGRLCKATVEIGDPARLGSEVARMVALARSGRPGPVLIAIPEDVLDRQTDAPMPEVESLSEPTPPEAEAVRAAVETLAGADRPVILAGGGVLRSGPRALAALRRVAERWQVPVIAAWRRPDVFPNDHPLYLGMAGIAAPAPVRDRLLGADLLLAVGCRLSEITSFGYRLPGPATALVQIDREPGLPGRRRQPELAVAADAAAFLEALLAADPMGAAGLPADVRRARQAANEADRAAYLAASELPGGPPGEAAEPGEGQLGGGGVQPAAVVAALRRLLPEGAVLTTDAGNFGGWAARHLRLPAGARFLGPTSGAMGYALPAAIGAAVAEPERPAVVALAGDGGFAMLMAELETAVRERARVTAVVFDNGMYGTIRMHQEEAHPGRVVATDLGPIDFAAVARACGAQAWRVERDADVAGALEAALAADAPGVVHVLTDPRALSVDRRLDVRGDTIGP